MYLKEGGKSVDCEDLELVTASKWDLVNRKIFAQTEIHKTCASSVVVLWRRKRFSRSCKFANLILQLESPNASG